VRPSRLLEAAGLPSGGTIRRIWRAVAATSRQGQDSAKIVWKRVEARTQRQRLGRGPARFPDSGRMQVPCYSTLTIPRKTGKISTGLKF
jgi:hypothetical protein